MSKKPVGDYYLQIKKMGFDYKNQLLKTVTDFQKEPEEAFLAAYDRVITQQNEKWSKLEQATQKEVKILPQRQLRYKQIRDHQYFKKMSRSNALVECESEGVQCSTFNNGTFIDDWYSGQNHDARGGIDDDERRAYGYAGTTSFVPEQADWLSVASLGYDTVLSELPGEQNTIKVSSLVHIQPTWAEVQSLGKNAIGAIWIDNEMYVNTKWNHYQSCRTVYYKTSPPGNWSEGEVGIFYCGMCDYINAASDIA